MGTLLRAAAKGAMAGWSTRLWNALLTDSGMHRLILCAPASFRAHSIAARVPLMTV